VTCNRRQPVVQRRTLPWPDYSLVAAAPADASAGDCYDDLDGRLTDL
jgi:hypothetical protein